MSLNDICHNIIYCDNIIYAVILHIMGASRVAQWIKNLPAMQEMQADAGLTPGLERSPGGGHSNALQYSCLENPMDRGTW